MNISGRSDRNRADLSRRVREFRAVVDEIGDAPTSEDFERLLAMAAELNLQEEEIADDLAGVRAGIEGAELSRRMGRGEIPRAKAPDPLAPGDQCHFVAPVRFGRRRSDQYGHLVLTSGWLKFRGTLDLSVAWDQVATVDRLGREIVVSLEDSRRLFRFSCHSLGEAARGAVIAQYLARSGRPRTVDVYSAHHHAGT